MENVNEIIELLIAIEIFSKDIHYNCKGESFYSKHILCDRINKDISDYIDSIKEICFLAKGIIPLPGKDYFANAIKNVPNIYQYDEQNFKELANIIITTLEKINYLNDLSKAEDNLFGNIAENLQNSLGLLLRQVI